MRVCGGSPVCTLCLVSSSELTCSAACAPVRAVESCGTTASLCLRRESSHARPVRGRCLAAAGDRWRLGLRRARGLASPAVGRATGVASAANAPHWSASCASLRPCLTIASNASRLGSETRSLAPPSSSAGATVAREVGTTATRITPPLKGADPPSVPSGRATACNGSRQAKTPSHTSAPPRRPGSRRMGHVRIEHVAAWQSSFAERKRETQTVCSGLGQTSVDPRRSRPPCVCSSNAAVAASPPSLSCGR